MIAVSARSLPPIGLTKLAVVDRQIEVESYSRERGALV